MSAESPAEDSYLRETVEELGDKVKQLERDLAITRKELKTEMEQTQQRVRRVVKELGEEKGGLDDVRARLREEIARLEVETAGSVRLSKEILHVLEENDKVRETELEEIRNGMARGAAANSELAATFTTDIGNCRQDLLYAITAQKNNLEASFSSQFSTHIEAIKCLLTAAETAIQSTINHLNEQFAQWTDTHNQEHRSQSAAFEGNWKEIRKEMEDFRGHLEGQIRKVGDDVKASTEEMKEKVRKSEETLKENIGKRLKEVEEILLKAKETEKRRSLEHAQIRAQTTQIQLHFESLLSAHKTEYSASNLKLEALIASKEQQIQQFILCESANLADKLTHECEKRLEDGVSGLRSKLAV